MPAISFKAKLVKIKDWIILRLPEEASAKLPSRCMVMVAGTLNKIPFKKQFKIKQINLCLFINFINKGEKI